MCWRLLVGGEPTLPRVALQFEKATPDHQGMRLVLNLVGDALRFCRDPLALLITLVSPHHITTALLEIYELVVISMSCSRNNPCYC